MEKTLILSTLFKPKPSNQCHRYREMVPNIWNISTSHRFPKIFVDVVWNASHDVIMYISYYAKSERTR